MCGIAGIVGPGATRVALEPMVVALRHRGPDAEGLWVGDGVALGHTRLAILDLDARADQPLWSSDGQRVCTYNGELYNFDTLRATAGLLRTACDTELFVAAADASAPAFLARLRGMFAVGVHDQGSPQVVTLARDALGIKPLFVASVPGGFVFASEMRALLASGLVASRVAPSAVVDVLRYGATVSPTTSTEGVRRLDPGTVVQLGSDGEHTERFDDGPDVSAPTIADALRESVAAHLLGDVEVGLFLSGGVDSSVLARCLGDLGATTRALTLSTGQSGDEVAAAAETARAYGLNHVVVDLGDDEISDACRSYFDAMDEPTNDGFNTFLVARAAAQAGLKVCLSGTGADELLGGYPIERQLRRIGQLHRLPARARDRAASLVAGVVPSRRARRIAASLRLAVDPKALLDLAHRVFLEDEVGVLVGPGVTRDASRLPGDDRVGYLRDVLLTNADVFAMAHGVEVRVPYVDRPVWRTVEAASSRRCLTKRDLVAGFDDELLRSRLRQGKRGFTLVIGPWMRGPLRWVVDRLLEDPPECLMPHLSVEGVATAVHSWASRLGPADSEIWTLAALYQWGDRRDRLAVPARAA